MALNPGSLIGAITGILQAFPPTGVLCATQLAAAYGTYASAGMFGVCPINVTAGQSALQAALIPALSNPLTGNPAIFAAAWVAGLTAFWTPATVLIIPVPPVTVAVLSPAGCPGAAAVGGVVAAQCANVMNVAPAWAAAVGAALHSATMTVQGLLTVPPAPPAPTPIL